MRRLFEILKKKTKKANRSHNDNIDRDLDVFEEKKKRTGVEDRIVMGEEKTKKKKTTSTT